MQKGVNKIKGSSYLRSLKSIFVLPKKIR